MEKQRKGFLFLDVVMFVSCPTILANFELRASINYWKTIIKESDENTRSFSHSIKTISIYIVSCF